MELRDPRPPDLTPGPEEEPFGDRIHKLLTGSDGVEMVVSPPAGHPRFPLVDGVRALAALAVVVTHAGFTSEAATKAWYGRFTARLDVGVAVFFAIAGFLLFRPYLSEYVDSTPAPTFGRYLFRRGLRIVPGYWVALTILALLGWITFDSRWVEHYLLVQSYDRYELFSGIVPAWSLATEVAFYLTLPALVMMLRSERSKDRRARVRAGAIMVGGLWLLSIGFRLALWELHRGQSSIWFNALPGTLDWFAAGMGLAVLSVAAQRREPRPRVVVFLEAHPLLSWAAAGSLFVLVSTGLGASGTWGQAHTLAGWLAMHVLYGVIAVLVLAPAVFPGQARSLVHVVLGHPILSALGVISFGIFLYNGPIAVWLSRSGLAGLWAGKPFWGVLLATLALSIVAGALSYRLIERPLLAFKDWGLGLRPPAAHAPAHDVEHPTG